MKNKKKTQKYTEDEILEAVRKFVLNAKKGSGKKQKLADAGIVDPKTPTISTDSTVNATIEKAMQDALNSANKENAPQDDAGSVSGAMDWVGAILSASESIAGEQDEYGAYDSDIQALFGQSSSFSSLSDSLDMLQSDDPGTDGLAVLNLLAPGVGGIATNMYRSELGDKERKEKALSDAALKERNARSFKNGGKVDDDPKKKKESVAGESSKSQAEINRRYTQDTTEDKFFDVESVINDMEGLGYQPAGEDRSDRIQGGYNLTPELEKLYNTFETRDIQDYLISQGANLDNFGEDNVFGIETGDSFVRYLSERNSVDPINPVPPGEVPYEIPNPEVKRANEMKRLMYLSPNNNVYYAEPDKFATGKERAKKFKRANQKELISYADEVGISEKEAREVLKKENGIPELVEKINKKQGISDKLQKAYLSQAQFPTYNDGVFKEFKKPLDEKGEYRLTKEEETYAEGGEIQGKGTAKSDSINAEIPPGSFIIPADAPKESVNALMKYLNYDDSKAKVNQPDGVPVKISDGEYYIPEEDTAKADMYAKKLGYKNGLNDLAPNAKTEYSPAMMADGGFLNENAGTLAGSLQMLLANVVAQENEEPESNTSEYLKNLSDEVRMRASYGLDPYERTQAENQIKNSMAREADMIKAISGGSIDVAMNNMASSAMRANQGILNVETASEQKRIEKERYADEITMKAIMADERDFERKYNKYLATEEAVAGLTHAGIGNIVGQSQFNRTMDVMEGQNADNWWEKRGRELLDGSQEKSTETKRKSKEEEEKERIIEDTDWITGQNRNPYF